MNKGDFMNGGRGAKGSINDRLINMMYKNRYKLEQNKKDSYTKEGKQKQKEYLKKMQTFDVSNDRNYLDEKDKKVVDQTLREMVVPNPGVSEDVPKMVERVLKEPEQKVSSNPSLTDMKNTGEKTDTNASSFDIKGKEISNTPIPFTADYERKVASIKSGGEAIESNPTPSLTRIHELNDKMIEIDINSEVFDFDNYDYYEVTPAKRGKAEDTSDDFTLQGTDEALDIDREIEKVEDEETILTELTTFIDDSQEVIAEIKVELESVRELVSQSETQGQIEGLEERYAAIRAKVDKLKAQYDVVKEKYNFEDFKILESIEMMAAIEDYQDKASLDELETMVDVCKSEIDQIDGILIEEQRSHAVAEEVEEQKREVVKRDQDFEKNRAGVIYLNDLEKKIAQEAREQAAIIADLERQLGDFTTTVETVRTTVYHTERLFGSFFRVAAGILTAPFSGNRIFGTMLGTHLINRGIRQLRDFMNPDVIEKTEIKHRYKDIEREILNSKDYVKTTANLIDDSLHQLDKFDAEFKLRFSAYSSLIPAYAEVERKIDSLKKSLKIKKEEVNVMSKDLDRQYEANKVKVKKAS